MEKTFEANSLSMPLFNILGNLGHAEYGWYHRFEASTLFGSLTRLFSFYQRIISAVQNHDERNRGYLDVDIESFIIRMRIILNDVAFIIWQILPRDLQGLKGPNGGVHPKNKEMSIKNLFKCFEKNNEVSPEINEVLMKNKKWIFYLKDRRDNIVHYKSKVIVLGTKPDLSFAMLSAAGTETTILTENGGERLITIPIFYFVNDQTLSLYNFLNHDLYYAIIKYIERNKMKYKEIGSDSRMSCIGIALFKQINKESITI